MVSGTNDRYLTAEVALPIIREVAEPYLWSYDLVTTVPEDRKSFMYAYDDTGKSGDSKKQKPPEHLIGAGFPEVDIGRMKTAGDVIGERGFQMRLSDDLLNDPVIGGTELARCFQTAGFWFAQIDNENILTAMQAGATTSFNHFSPDNTWDSVDASPVTDLVHFAQDGDSDTFPIQIDTFFVNKTNFFELNDSLINIDVDGSKQERVIGMPTIAPDYIDIPVAGRVNKVRSGMDEGSLMGVDSRLKAGELHYYNNPKYSVPSFTYDTIDPMTKAATTVTVPNLGYNFYQYEEDDTHDTVMQFWVTNDTIVKNSAAVLYSASGI